MKGYFGRNKFKAYSMLVSLFMWYFDWTAVAKQNKTKQNKRQNVQRS